MAAKKLEVVVTGDTKGAQRAMGQLEGKATGFAGKMNRVGAGVRSSFSSMSAVAVKSLKAIGTVAAVTAIGVAAALGATINDASSQAEAISKVQQVFGTASIEVQKWASTSADAFGQSKTQALEAAGTYGNLFQSFGLGADSAKQMSVGLVELASDLASFNNTSVDDALAALQSGVSGETEPLKRYGIALNEAGLKAEALNLGLIKANVSSAKVNAAVIAQEKAQRALSEATKKYGADSIQAREATSKFEVASEKLADIMGGAVPAALTPAQKAQASYSLIMKASALAQGDFARTSDGLANKQRILTAKFEDMKARIGSGLLPIVLKLAEAGEKYLLPVLEEGAGAVRSFFAAFSNPGDGITSGGFAGQIEALGLKARSVFDGLKVRFGEVVGGVKAFVAAFKDGGDDITSSGFAGWLEALGMHARNAFDAMARNWHNVVTAFTVGGKAVWSALFQVYDALRPVVQAIVRFVQNNPGPVFTALAVIIGGALLSATWAWAAAVIAALSPVYLIIGAIALLAGGLVWAYQNVGWFRDAVDAASAYITGTAIPALQQFWSWFSQKILPVLKQIVSFYASAWVTAIKGYIAYIGFMVDKAMILWGFFSRNLLPILMQMAGFLAGYFVASVGLARDALSWVIDKAGILWQKLAPLRESLGALASFLAADFRTGLRLGRDALGWVASKAKTLYDWLKKVVGMAHDAVDAIKSLPSKIPGSGVVSDGVGAIPGFASGGRPPVGSPYLVGENGPELRIDGRPGTIIPNNRIAMPSRGSARPAAAGGGGGGNVYQIQVTESRDAKTTAREVVREINRETRNAGRSPLMVP